MLSTIDTLNTHHSTLNFYRGEEVGDYEGAAADVEHIVGRAVAQGRAVGFFNSGVCRAVQTFGGGFLA